MAPVTVHEAKTHLSHLNARALDGEDVIIARGKEPKVRLVPVKEVRPLGRACRAAWRDNLATIANAEEPVLVSTICAIEIATKHVAGKRVARRLCSKRLN